MALPLPPIISQLLVNFMENTFEVEMNENKFSSDSKWTNLDDVQPLEKDSLPLIIRPSNSRNWKLKETNVF